MTSPEPGPPSSEAPGRIAGGLAIAAVTLATLTDALVYGVVVPVLPSYATGLGLSQSSIGLLLAAYAGALLVGTPIFGWVSDRYGRRLPMLAGLLGLAAATIAFAFARDFASLAAARLLQGFAGAASWTAGLALLGETLAPERRGRGMGIAMAGASAGSILGPAIGGWMYELLGYESPFIATAALALTAAALIATLPPMRVARQALAGGPWRIARDRHVIWIAIVTATAAAGLGALEPTLPLALTARFGVTPGVVGTFFLVLSLAHTLTAPAAGALSDRFGTSTTMTIGFICAGVALPLIAVPDSLYVAGGVAAVFGIALAAAIIPTMPVLAEAVERIGDRAYGTAYAIFNGAYAVGLMIGPVIGSAIAERAGLPLALAAFGASYVLVGGLMRRGLRGLVPASPHSGSGS